jgi:hypothetical protein
MFDSDGTGDGDSEGGLELLRFVSSDIYVSIPPVRLRKSRVCTELTYKVNDDALHMVWDGLCSDIIQPF